MKHFESLIIIVLGSAVFIFVASVASSLAYNSVKMSEIKSDAELCKERGGKWYRPYRSEGICLSKEMLK